MSDLSDRDSVQSSLNTFGIETRLSRAEIEERTLQTLTRVLARLNAPIRAALSNSGMSLSHVVLLRILISRGEATASELAEELALTNGAVTQLLKKLESKKLVTRQRKDQDRRIVHVKMTERATRRYDRLHMATLSELSAAFNGWAIRDIKELRRLLTQLTD